jgi:hypothetical protein
MSKLIHLSAGAEGPASEGFKIRKLSIC